MYWIRGEGSIKNNVEVKESERREKVEFKSDRMNIPTLKFRQILKTAQAHTPQCDAVQEEKNSF